MFIKFLVCFFIMSFNFLFAVIREDDNLSVIRSYQEVSIMLNELFSFPTHSDTPQRRIELSNWLMKDNPSVEILTERYNFLLEYWNNEHFRIFDKPDEAYKYLKDNHKSNVLFRLSSTKSGQITISFKRANKIFHSRYEISGIYILHDNQKFTLPDFINLISGKNYSVAEYVVSNH